MPKFEMDHHHHGKIWTIKFLTSSNLRSASSAMCLASFSCISWISIFSSSFIARFSITFIPLIGRDTVKSLSDREYKTFHLEMQFHRTSRSRLRPSRPLPVSAVPPTASPGLGPAPPRPAGSCGSELLRHPPPDRSEQRRQRERGIGLFIGQNYSGWSLTPLPPWSRKLGERRGERMMSLRSKIQETFCNYKYTSKED